MTPRRTATGALRCSGTFLLPQQDTISHPPHRSLAMAAAQQKALAFAQQAGKQLTSLGGIAVKSVAAVTSSAKEVSSSPLVKTFLANASKELGPPSMAQWPQIQKGFQTIVRDAQKMAFLQTPLKEGVKNGLVAVEILCWFYVGEIMGRGSLIGYNV